MIKCPNCKYCIHGIIPIGKEITCYQCNYRFINENLEKEMIEDKKGLCLICEKIKPTNHKNICDDCYNESIKNDYEKNLPNHKPYKCLQCGKRFGQPTNSFIHKCRGKKI
jgi:hypothetical protein